MDVLLDEMRSELSALSDAYPKGASLPELAGYFGVPLARIEPAINTLFNEGAICLKGSNVTFGDRENARLMQARVSGAAGGLARGAQLLADDEAARVRTFELRDAILAAGAETGYSLTLADAVRRVRDAVPIMAEHFPSGISAREIAATLGLQPERVYKAVRAAVAEGWCEEVKACGNRASGIIAVFDGMMVPPPKLTDLQQKVYDWMLTRVRPDGTCEMNMHQCAMDVGVTLVNDKLDSMENKRYIAQLTPYQDVGSRVSPTYKILDPPKARRPDLHASPTAKNVSALGDEIEARGIEAVAQEPIALRRAKDRKARLEAELREINEFLATFARLSK